MLKHLTPHTLCTTLHPTGEEPAIDTYLLGAGSAKTAPFIFLKMMCIPLDDTG